MENFSFQIHDPIRKVDVKLILQESFYSKVSEWTPDCIADLAQELDAVFSVESSMEILAELCRDNCLRCHPLAAFLVCHTALGMGGEVSAHWIEDSSHLHSDTVEASPSTVEKFPRLLQLYVDAFAMEGLQLLSRRFSACSVRQVLADVLLRFWQDEELQSALRATRHRHLLQSFLEAVFQTVLHSAQCAIEKIQAAPRGKCDQNASSELHPAIHNAADDTCADDLGLVENFQLLCLLLKEECVAECLKRTPFSHQATTWLLGLSKLCLGPEINDALTRDYGVDDFKKQVDAAMLGTFAQALKESDNLIMLCPYDFVHVIQASKDFLNTHGVSQDRMDTIDISIDNVMEMYRNLKAVGAFSEHEDMPLYHDKMVHFCLTTESLVQSHSFRAILEKYDPTSKKVKILEKEMKNMQNNLPVLPEKAIFVVRDTERDDVLRCVVSGPVGTPYSGGLFVFDVYCPDGYPSVPPLVRFLTTGYGTADFHACLHVNGEVFLNLLGTGSADDGSGAWNPETSSISQVLESIQSLILKENPLYSYRLVPPPDQSEESKVSNLRHNSLVQMLTLRHAMLENLRNPLQGLEEVIRQHFTLQAADIYKQCGRWIMDSPERAVPFSIFWLLMLLLGELDTIPEEKKIQERLLERACTENGKQFTMT